MIFLEVNNVNEYWNELQSLRLHKGIYKRLYDARLKRVFKAD